MNPLTYSISTCYLPKFNSILETLDKIDMALLHTSWPFLLNVSWWRAKIVLYNKMHLFKRDNIEVCAKFYGKTEKNVIRSV